MITTIIGNSNSPQLLDLKHLAGFAIVIASAVGGGSAGPGRETQFGTHAQQMYAQNTISTQVFHSAPGKQSGKIIPRTIATLPQYVDPPPPLFFSPPVAPILGMQSSQYQFGTHAKAIYDSQIQAQIFRPVVVESGGFFGAEYSFGTHQKAIIDSQIQAQVFKPVVRPIAASDLAPIRVFLTNPQELSTDLTLQGWSKTVPVAQGFLLTMVTAGPQFADLTQQAQISASQPFQSLAPPKPLNPAFFFAQPQFDITQIPGRVIKPPGRVAAVAPIRPVIAAPTPWDFTQIQGLIIQPSLPGPSKFVQPALVLSFEQQYDKTIYPVAFQPAIQIGGIPPVTTGFRVTAVTAGYYNGVYYVPGDVFDILTATDFSDSSIDYQPPSSATTGFGWMARVPSTTPLYVWEQANENPYFPAADPNRRFVF